MEAPGLRTSRLEFRAFAAVDIEELLALFRNADVRRWLLDDQLVTEEWVADEIAASEARFRSMSCGLWALSERTRDRIIGFVGFRPFFDPPELQLLYGFHPSHWRRGFATEAAAAAIDYAFDVLGFYDVRAATDVPNTASIAVLERLGMSQRKRSADGSHGTVFFDVTADEWAKRRRLTNLR